MHFLSFALVLVCATTQVSAAVPSGELTFACSLFPKGTEGPDVKVVDLAFYLPAGMTNDRQQFQVVDPKDLLRKQVLDQTLSTVKADGSVEFSLYSSVRGTDRVLLNLTQRDGSSTFDAVLGTMKASAFIGRCFGTRDAGHVVLDRWKADPAKIGSAK